MDLFTIEGLKQFVCDKKLPTFAALLGLAILSLPECAADFLGVTPYRDEHRHYIGFAILCSLCVHGVHLCRIAWRYGLRELRTREEKRTVAQQEEIKRESAEKQKRLLNSLNREQQEVINGFVSEGSVFCTLDPFNHHVDALRRAGILVPLGKGYIHPNIGAVQDFLLSEVAREHLYPQVKGSAR